MKAIVTESVFSFEPPAKRGAAINAISSAVRTSKGDLFMQPSLDEISDSGVVNTLVPLRSQCADSTCGSHADPVLDNVGTGEKEITQQVLQKYAVLAYTGAARNVTLA
jgi:hypothetical protein